MRLGILSGVLSLGLLATDRVQASGVALFVALLSVALAVLTWVVWTLGEVLVHLAALGVLLHRVGRGMVRGARSPVSRGRALVGIALLLVVVTPAQAQQVVIDPTNLVQNTISALKMIESVINEAAMIANQLEQIRVMIQNTTNYPEGIWDREALPRLLRRSTAQRSVRRPRQHHRRTATIITSNRAVEECVALFGDRSAATALDRFTHRAHQIVIEEPRLRAARSTASRPGRLAAPGKDVLWEAPKSSSPPTPPSRPPVCTGSGPCHRTPTRPQAMGRSDPADP